MSGAGWGGSLRVGILSRVSAWEECRLEACFTTGWAKGRQSPTEGTVTNTQPGRLQRIGALHFSLSLGLTISHIASHSTFPSVRLPFVTPRFALFNCPTLNFHHVNKTVSQVATGRGMSLW